MTWKQYTGDAGTAQPQTPAPAASKPRIEIDPVAAIRQLRIILVLTLVVLVIGVVGGLALGITLHSDNTKIQQLTTDVNDNLCNQQAYQGGTQCQGGDANGGSSLP